MNVVRWVFRYNQGMESVCLRNVLVSKVKSGSFFLHLYHFRLYDKARRFSFKINEV